MLRTFLLCPAIAAAAATLSLACFTNTAHAQNNFPTRPIRVVSPFATGSISDITLRLLAERAGMHLKSTIVVENMPSGGGVQAALSVKNSPSDGYTLILLSNATAVTMATFKNPGFDPITDFVPISGMSEFAYLLLTKYDGEHTSFKDFVAAARARPGALNVGTSAPGTTPYLTALMLEKANGVDYTLVPFRGATDLHLALMRGDIDVMVNTYGPARQNLASRQVRAIAATSATRSSFLPDVPTVEEAGVPGFEASSWNAIYAPTSTPAAVVAKLSQVFGAALAEPDLHKRFADLGVEVWPGKADALTIRMKNEIARWNKVVDDFGIKRE